MGMVIPCKQIRTGEKLHVASYFSSVFSAEFFPSVQAGSREFLVQPYYIGTFLSCKVFVLHLVNL